MKHGLRGLAVALIVSSTYPVLSGEYHTAECDQVQGDINRTTDALSADLHNFRGRTATKSDCKRLEQEELQMNLARVFLYKCFYGDDLTEVNTRGQQAADTTNAAMERLGCK